MNQGRQRATTNGDGKKLLKQWVAAEGAANGVCGSGAKKLRRWPWLSASDYVTLCALPPAMQREFENLLLHERRSDNAFRANVTLECDFDADFDHVIGCVRARWIHGTGGGRHIATCDPAP
jgi:hypothetical protein